MLHYISGEVCLVCAFDVDLIDKIPVLVFHILKANIS